MDNLQTNITCKQFKTHKTKYECVPKQCLDCLACIVSYKNLSLNMHIIIFSDTEKFYNA